MKAIELKTTLPDLDSKIYKMFQMGARLIAITGNDLGDGKFELIYHFSKGADATNLKVEIEEDTVVESITGLFPYADLMECELLDYFGIKVAGARPNVFLEAGSGICTPLRKETKSEPKDQSALSPDAKKKDAGSGRPANGDGSKGGAG